MVPYPAVFDLDGTLLHGDSTSEWMKGRIGQSWLRILMAAVIVPIALPLAALSQSRKVGASLFLWIASLGLDEAGLRASFGCFAQRMGSGARLTWRERGLDELNEHLASGRRVVVATAAPAWLAEPLVARLGSKIVVVGSTVRPFCGGWVALHHCRNRGKCEALANAGYGERWAFAYSDCADDIPLLAGAIKPYLVNGTPATVARLEKTGLAIEHVSW